ncbi:MAG: FtsW/RodA/SpoVE family cell cycle protein [Bacteroidales bacterium]|nr:FtsW/RodA/SpoVE family cell cycle protein [Bacteroidales bacterium]MCF8392220.1 FtsW/RodA/SpoVE family cell cycle protein [Bacteroidales bacterium]
MIWIVVIILAVISLLAVYSSSQSLAYSSANSTFYYLIKQIVILFIGFMALFLSHMVPYRYYSKLSQILLYVVVLLLIFTLIAGRDVNSARRSINIPGFGITMQPSDFAKIILIMYVARILSIKQDSLNNFKETFLPLMAWVGIVSFLILPANFSTAALLFFTAMTLMFIGRIPVKFLLLILAGFALAVFLFIQALSVLNIDGRAGTWERRIENFRNKDNESVKNYQINRAKVAIVNGGLIGKGPGNSLQKEKLPQANSDFIYAIIIEEYGIIGGIVVLFLYMYILFRTALMVRKSVRTFPAMLAMGLSLLIVFQALINMGVAVSLLPVTGQPLPFISSGGSSVVFTSIAIGVILSVSWGIEEDQNNLADLETKSDNGE